MGHCTSNVVNEFHSVACLSELELIWDFGGSGFDHSRDTFLSCNCHCTLWNFELWTTLVSLMWLKIVYKLGPTLCTYLYSQAVLIQSSYITTCFSGSQHHQQGRQHHRPKNSTNRRCLYSHAHAPTLWVRLQQQACLFHTYWEVWHKQALCWRGTQHLVVCMTR